MNPRIPSHLIWRQVDDNTVVVSPRSGKMRVLNGVGSVIWQLIADEKPVNFIVEHLTTVYNISHEQAQTDVDSFLIDLRERNLLEFNER
jgi:hypothetical protein